MASEPRRPISLQLTVEQDAWLRSLKLTRESVITSALDRLLTRGAPAADIVASDTADLADPTVIRVAFADWDRIRWLREDCWTRERKVVSQSQVIRYALDRLRLTVPVAALPELVKPHARRRGRPAGRPRTLSRQPATEEVI